MLIDWFTVAAQAVNFLILVWLLKRFLYGPIVRAIDERETRVAAQLRDAAAMKNDALKQRDDVRRKIEALARDRAALLARAAEEAEAERRRRFDDIRRESEALRTRLQETFRSERDAFNRELAGRVQHEVVEISRQVIAALSSVGLEATVVEAFVRRLRGLGDEEKERLRGPADAPRRPARVRSAFELTPDGRAALERVARETLAADTEVQFETAPELVCGVELAANGHKVAWSVADYLASLEKRAGALLEEHHDHGASRS